MREKWMRFISLFLVGILCCSIFAGCSSNVSEEDIQGPEAISQGKVTRRVRFNCTGRKSFDLIQ